jgi:uncharacterized protein YecE (DUF72 family)
MRGDLRVGCCGFPVSLQRYAGEFRVTEVQQTFYQPPRPRTLARWRALVDDEFEFTLKAWQLITHEPSSPTYRRLREKLSEQQKREVGGFRLSPAVMAAWERTAEAACILRSRIILFQCPASFTPSPENKANLRAFFREIRARSSPPQRWTLAWEPRGRWQPAEVRELCQELGLVHAVDPFVGRPVTAGMGYFRLHGRGGYRYRYTDGDLRQLLERALENKPCYVLFNNIAMAEDARRFLRLCAAAGAR